MPTTGGTDELIELRHLLGRAQASTLTVKAAQHIQERARQLAEANPSPEAATCLSRIEREVGSVLSVPPRIGSRRCRRLEKALAEPGPIGPARIEAALVSSDLAKQKLTDLIEIRDFQATISPFLYQLRETLSDVDFSPNNFKRLTNGLARLADALPEGIPGPQQLVLDLRDELCNRRDSHLAEHSLEEALRRLRRSVSEQKGRQELEAMCREVAGNRWALEHPYDSRVVEAHDLMERLSRTAMAMDEIEEICGRVSTLLDHDEARPAIEQLAQAYQYSEEHSLRYQVPLEAVTARVVTWLADRLKRVELGAGKPNASPDEIQDRIDRLDELTRWLDKLTRLADLDDQGLAEHCAAVRGAEIETLQRAVLDSEKAAFKNLTKSELPAYIARLDRFGLALVHEWAEKVSHFQKDLDALESAETIVGEDVLRRLELAGRELGGGPAEDAMHAVSGYRDAVAALDHIETLALTGTSLSDQETSRLQEIRKQLPRCRRAEELEGFLQDSLTIRQMRSLVEDASSDGIGRCLEMVGSIGSEARRLRVKRALLDLQIALSAIERFEDAVSVATTRLASLESRRSAIDGMVAAADRFIAILKEESFPISKSEFEAPWANAEERMAAHILGRLPGEIRSWLEEFLSTAKDPKDLESCRDSLNRWLEVSQDPSLSAECLQALDRHSARMNLSKLLEQRHWDEAEQLMEQTRNALSLGERAELQSWLHQGRALEDHCDGNDPSLKRIMEVIVRWGTTSELCDIVLEHFRTTGNPAHLVRIARRWHDQLPTEEPFATVCSWAGLLEKGQRGPSAMQPLVTELANSRSTAAWEIFLDAIAHDFPAAIYLLTTVGERRQRRKRGLQRLNKATLKACNDKLRDQRQALAETAMRMQAAFKADTNPRSDCAITLEAAADQIREATEVLLGLQKEHAACEGKLRGVEIWLRPIGQFAAWEDVKDTLQKIGDRLNRGQQTIERMKQIVRRLEADDPGACENVRLLMESLGTTPLPVVQKAIRTLQVICSERLEVVRTLEKLIAARAAGGEGMAADELTRLDRHLRRTLSYSMVPEEDRFGVLPLLGDTAYQTLLDELREMVKEISTVDGYERECKRLLMVTHDGLKVRLKRIHQDGNDVQRDAEVQGVAELLTARIDGSRSLQEAVEDEPVVELSQYAMKRLKKIFQSDWYCLLKEAIYITQSR